jgi:hypothetical protein
MNACESICSGLGSALGPELSQIVLGVLGLLLVWWRGRQQTAKVAAQVVAVTAIATDARQQLVEIKGSLRPPAFETNKGLLDDANKGVDEANKGG